MGTGTAAVLIVCPAHRHLQYLLPARCRSTTPLYLSGTLYASSHPVLQTLTATKTLGSALGSVLAAPTGALAQKVGDMLGSLLGRRRK
jgi:hypothetical protein